jgi:aspartyl-tRNA(Asn)/glutamyl-tRNA(Gln) amidotransferase subunit C
MDREPAKKAAKAAHLALSEEELDRYCMELGEIIENFKALGEVPNEGPYSLNPIEVADILRDDVAGIFVDPYELLKDMKTYENYVRGPRLL